MTLDPQVPVLDPGELADRVADGTPLIVLFYADWCGFSAAYLGTFSKEIQEVDTEVVAADLTSDHDPRWQDHRIQTVPTLVAFQEGKEAARKDGIPGRGLREGQLIELAQRV